MPDMRKTGDILSRPDLDPPTPAPPGARAGAWSAPMLAAVMADSSDGFQLVSVAEACRVLGLSDSTLRRLIRAGRLEAQKVERPQGHVWMVKVPAPTSTSSADPPFQLGAADGHPPVAPAADAMVSLIQTTIGTVLGPLVGQLDAQRQTIERQADRVAELERELGRFAAERDAAEARYAALEARTAAQSPEPTQTPSLARLCTLLPWLVAVLAVVLVLVLVLVPS